MVSNFIKLGEEEFRKLSKLIYAKFGIVLGDQKKSLVEGRLQKSVKALNFISFKEYYDYLKKDITGEALTDLINNISTNYTFFNREQSHFQFLLDKALPEIMGNLRKKHSRDLRLWSAASSTGEEPYTIITSIMDRLGHEYKNWDAGLLATDISERALAIAKNGLYSNEKMSELPPHLKTKYFTKLKDGSWKVKDYVRKEVVYRKFNLMSPSFSFKKPFHIIFCRNVMIYFDQKTRDQLVRKFYSIMEKGGYLFIGHSESLSSDSPFKYLKSSIYQKI